MKLNTQPGSGRRGTGIHMVMLVAVFASIATILMFFELQLPFLPPFLKLDLSGVPVLLLSLIFGPGPAIYVALVKDMLHMLVTQTGGVGEFADFLILSTTGVVLGALYQKYRTPRGLFYSAFAGIAAMIVVGVLANRFLLIPFYATVVPIESILEACSTVNPAVNSINTYLIFGAAPFNLIKGSFLFLLALLLHKGLAETLQNMVE